VWVAITLASFVVIDGETKTVDLASAEEAILQCGSLTSSWVLPSLVTNLYNWRAAKLRLYTKETIVVMVYLSLSGPQDIYSRGQGCYLQEEYAGNIEGLSVSLNAAMTQLLLF
jgi:low temperature requirement protein LtrA